jgi:cob(I)alamin adenosyltransferase
LFWYFHSVKKQQHCKDRQLTYVNRISNYTYLVAARLSTLVSLSLQYGYEE